MPVILAAWRFFRFVFSMRLSIYRLLLCCFLSSKLQKLLKITELTFFRYLFMDKKPPVLPSTISFFAIHLTKVRELVCTIKFHGLTSEMVKIAVKARDTPDTACILLTVEVSLRNDGRGEGLVYKHCVVWESWILLFQLVSNNWLLAIFPSFTGSDAGNRTQALWVRVTNPSHIWPLGLRENWDTLLGC